MNTLTGHQLLSSIDSFHYSQELSLNELSLKNLEDVTIDDPSKKATFIEKITCFLNNPNQSTLDLSDLYLNDLPDIFMHQSFKERLLALNLSCNELNALPNSIGGLTKLESLNLSGNELTALPESIGGLSQLQTLLLSCNQLTTLPESIGKLTQLGTLEISSNQLTILPESIGGLIRLNILSLSENQLITLPDSIGRITALQILTLSENKLIALPDSIGGLPALVMLTFNENPMLTVLPDWIGQLAALDKLNNASRHLFNLRLNELSLKNLEDVAIDDPLKKASFIEKVTYFLNNRNQEVLDLSDLSLNELPDIFMHQFFKERLLNLNLSFNELTELPGSISRLTVLRTLNISNNQLATLPESIAQLPFLEELNLFGNSQLVDLPQTIITLSEHCVVNLIQCEALSHDVMNRLSQSLEQEGYVGPTFIFLDEDVENQNEQKRPIEILQNFCVKLELGAPPELRNVFNEDNKDEFSNLTSWMNRLSYTSDSMSSPESSKWFFGCVLNYLNLAERDADFRTTFFQTIADAGETCGDRVALSIIHLGIAQDLLKKNEIKDIYDFMKSCIYPMHILQECAINKIALSPNRDELDEIEVYLGYPVKLKEKLNIPINIKDMLYFRCSALTEEDLSNAYNAVLERVNNPAFFSEFLIKQSKWIEALKQEYKEEYKQLENIREEEAGLAEDANFIEINKKFNQGLLNLIKEAIEAVEKNNPKACE
jgi:Leucine-rich repeat (LRR) protein